MERQISAFLERVSGFYFPEIRFTDVLEVLILTFLIYQMIIWIKNTKAWLPSLLLRRSWYSSRN